MTRRFGALLALVFATACGGEKSTEGASSSAQSAKAAPAATASATAAASGQASAAIAIYKNPVGGYEIDFHGETPTESVKDDPNGASWHDASVGNGVAMVQYSDFTNAGEAEGTMKVFAPTRDPDKIKVDKEVAVDANKGRDIEMTLSSGKIFWIRFVQADKRLYKIGIVYSGDKAKAQSFVDSFRITKESAPAASSASASPATAPTTAPAAANAPRPSTPPAAPKPKPPSPDLNGF